MTTPLSPLIHLIDDDADQLGDDDAHHLGDDDAHHLANHDPSARAAGVL